MEQTMRIISYTPTGPRMRLDVMVGGRFRQTVAIEVTAGAEYRYGELKAFVRRRVAGLGGVDFDLLPSEAPLDTTPKRAAVLRRLRTRGFSRNRDYGKRRRTGNG